MDFKSGTGNATTGLQCSPRHFLKYRICGNFRLWKISQMVRTLYCTKCFANRTCYPTRSSKHMTWHALVKNSAVIFVSRSCCKLHAMQTVLAVHVPHLTKGTHSCQALNKSNSAHQLLWEHCGLVDTATLPMLTQHRQHGPHDGCTHHEAWPRPPSFGCKQQ